MRKNLLFVLRLPPQAGWRVREALDMILTAAAFDHSIHLLLLDDAVYLLKTGQHPEQAGLTPVAPLLEALELYDVENIWAERESLEERGLAVTDLLLPVREIERCELAGLLRVQDFTVAV